MLPVLTILLVTSVGCADGALGKVSPPAVGAMVADFRLADIHRRPRSLGGFKEKRAFAVFFVDIECPLANLYVPTQIELQERNAGRGCSSLRSIPANRTDL